MVRQKLETNSKMPTNFRYRVIEPTNECSLLRFLSAKDYDELIKHPKTAAKPILGPRTVFFRTYGPALERSKLCFASLRLT